MAWAFAGIASATAAVLLVILYLVLRGSQFEQRRIMNELATAQANDRMNYLNTLRRELANYLVWQDPDRYLQLYQLLHAETATFKDLQRSQARARLLELCKRYPQYQDFDLIGTRDYVIYPDALIGWDTADIERRYRDIATFQALMIAIDPEWQYFHATSVREAQHLTGYVQRVKDTKFRWRLERAIRERDIWQTAKDAAPGAPFSWSDVAVRGVPHVAEQRLGIHLKRSNEFGLYGFFMDDGGKIYESYYRTDSSFDKEGILDPLVLPDKFSRDLLGFA